jgi:DNA-directed RNA polymerase subunit RPC12/RpoP
MALKIPHCARCSAVCALQTLPTVSAEDGPLKVTLLGLPVFACAKNHRAPVHTDFMLWLIQEIRAREPGIAAGKETGMVFKKHLCGDCGKELAAKAERRGSFAYELTYEDLAPFRLELEMPLYRCTGCGKEQVRSAKDLHGHVPGAMVGINDSAGFPHSG